MKIVIRNIFLKQILIFKKLFNLHSDLPFLAERKRTEKCNKPVCSIHDKENYIVHIRDLKQALSHGLILKKVHKKYC